MSVKAPNRNEVSFDEAYGIDWRWCRKLPHIFVLSTLLVKVWNEISAGARHDWCLRPKMDMAGFRAGVLNQVER